MWYYWSKRNTISFNEKIKKRFEKKYIDNLLKIGIDKMTYNPDVDTLVIGSDEVFNCLQHYPVGYSRNLFGYEYEKSIEINQDLLFYGSSCYSAMLSKILDKLYAINLNMVRGDRVKFLCAMFFLLNVMDKKTINENLINLSMRSASSEFTQREALQLLESLDENAFADLASFINTLSKIEGLGSINLRVVINEYVKMYGRNTLFGLEYYPFFLFSIFSSVINSNLNNGYIIENLLGDQADKLFKAFSAVVQ